MILRKTVGSLAVALMLLAGRASLAEDAVLRKRFESECRDALTRLEARYAQIHGEYTVEQFRGAFDPETRKKIEEYERALEADRKAGRKKPSVTPPVIPWDKLPRPDVLTLRSHARFAIDRPHQKTEVLQTEAWSFQPSQPEVEPTKKKESAGSVQCEGPENKFSLTRSAPNAPWVVKKFEEPKGEGANGTKNGLYAPFSFWNKPLKSVLDHPSFVVRDVTAVREGEDAGVKVLFDYNPGPADLTRGGWVVFLPDRMWAVRRCEIKSADPHKIYQCEIEYAEGGEVPLPRRVTTLNLNFFTVREFQGLTLGPTPAEEFTLAAFGVPEMGKPAPALAEESSRTAYWVIAASLACLVLAIVLKRLARPRAGASMT